MQNEMFWAEKGKGTFLLDVQLKISAKSDSQLILACFNHPPLQNKSKG